MLVEIFLNNSGKHLEVARNDKYAMINLKQS